MRINEQFVYGFVLAIFLLSLLLGTQYGDNFNFLNETGLPLLPSFGTALNWKTACILAFAFSLFFKNIVGDVKNRVFYAFMLLTFSWVILDYPWIFKAYLQGNYLFGAETLTYLSVQHLIVGLFRNTMMFIVSSVFILKYLKFSWWVLLSLIIYLVYWVVMYLSFPHTTGLFTTLPFYFFNFLPIVAAFKEWRDIGWKKFLFV